MKNLTKSFFSGFVLFLFLIAACGSDDSKTTLGFILIPIAIIVGVIAIIVQPNKTDEEQKKKAIEMEERKKAKHKHLIETFGNPTKEICYNTESYLFVFEQKANILLNNQTYNFEDIINYNVSDNAVTIYSATVSETKTSTGSMLGRAVIGGILTGGAGAIIGGATAGKTTITQGGTSTIEHHYEINITVNSISNPIVKLNLGNDSDIVNEISSLLSVILTRNNKEK